MQQTDPHATCGAKTRSGGLCKSPPVKGATRCRMHGGTQPVGIAAHNFKTGRYSKHLPARLQERYQSALADDDLLAQNEEIALIDARLADVLGRVDTGESGAAWRAIQKAFDALGKAMRETDKNAIREALDTLDATIRRGSSDYAAWNELQSLVQQRRALVESERKRRVEMQQNISAEQAMLLVSALLDSVRRNVTDRDTLSAIQAEFVALTTREDRHRISSG